MALTVISTSQINSGVNGNANDLREVLNAMNAALKSMGATAPRKVDANSQKFLAAPAQCGFSVSGANGAFTYAITLPQQASGSTAPGNPLNQQIFQEISSSPAADFSSAVTTYPPTTSTSGTFANPGATLYWRLRSSYNQTTYNAYQVFVGAVSAGLQTSAASQPNLSLNQTNYATVDSVANGGTATVRIYGSGGVGSSWTSVLGTASKVIPPGTILNVAYATNGFVVWDGATYRVQPQLSQTFPDTWIPVGKVSVISNGSGLVLPTFKAIVTAGAIVAYQILTPGNGLTTPPILTITDTTGTGATATAVVSAGAVTQVLPGSAGSGYSATPVVTASGGVSGGVGGGGGANGLNSGRFYSDGTNS